MIPYSRPTVSRNETRRVREVIESAWLTTGPAVERFERAFAEKVGATFAVAFSSGTSALVGACAAAGLSHRHRLITSTLSFIASANCGRFFGAGIDLADVDDATMNVTADTVAKGLRKTTRAAVVVHYAGYPADLQSIRRVCKQNRVVLIEDAAHALGATYRGSTIGDCRHSDMCCFSFHPTKLITSAEGGMVTTNRKSYHDRLRSFRNHGITRSGRLQPWEYDCRELSFNWRLSDVHSAIGLAQLERMAAFLAKRRRIAAYYNRRFAEYEELVTPVERDGCRHAYHIYVLRFHLDRLTIGRRAIYDQLIHAGIGPQVHYRPIHRHTLYRLAGFRAKDFPAAERAYTSMLSLPMYPGLTTKDMVHVADSVCRIIERHRR